MKDLDDQPWEFVVKSWANGSEQRRVYVLEQASMFLRVNHLREGDIIGICCDTAGNLQVAANTPALSEAIARPNYGLNFARPNPKPLPGNSRRRLEVGKTSASLFNVYPPIDAACRCCLQVWNRIKALKSVSIQDTACT